MKDCAAPLPGMQLNDMMHKPRIHYHSDCDFFGGCESMLVNLFLDRRLLDAFDISFSYRAVPAYVEGLRRRLPVQPREQALKLLSDATPGLRVRRLVQPLSTFLLAAQSLLLLRYWILAWNTIRLVRAWRGMRIDLLHINNGGYPGASSSRAAVLAARILDIPRVLMVVNNIAAPVRLHERPVEAMLSRFMRNHVDAFVTGSHFAKRALANRVGGGPARLCSLHNGIGARRPDETVQQTRDRLGVAQDALVFAIVALHEPRKGHRILIEALALLKQATSPSRWPLLLVEGTGPEEGALREMTAALGLQDQILFTGQERNVFNLMQCADALVVPSVANEDFPNVVLEAMSLGKPVIASILAGIPEQVEDGVTGWLVPPGRPDALAEALSKMTAAPGLADLAGIRGRERFGNHFTAELAVGRYIEIYRDLLKDEEQK